MASREEVRVDYVADFSPQLEGSGLSPPRISIEVGSAMDGVGRSVDTMTFFDNDSRSEKFGSTIIAERLDDTGKPARVLFRDFYSCRDTGRVCVLAGCVLLRSETFERSDCFSKKISTCCALFEMNDDRRTLQARTFGYLVEKPSVADVTQGKVLNTIADSARRRKQP